MSQTAKPDSSTLYSPVPNQNGQTQQRERKCFGRPLSFVVLLSILIALIGLVVVLLLYIGLTPYDPPSSSSSSPSSNLPPFISFDSPPDDSDHHPTPHRSGGAVTANGEPCARIGSDILRKRNGSVADAAIVTMLCESIACPQSLGLGGGFIATLYIRSTGEALVLNAREVAPLAATADMFANHTAVTGAEAIAVPGALAGYWALHQRFGRLPWADLFGDAINLCTRGVHVSEYFAGLLAAQEPAIRVVPSLAELFVDPRTKRVWKAGQKMRFPRLAQTLQALAREGADGFYRPGGTVYEKLRTDLARMPGALLSEADFGGYRVRWTQPATAKIQSAGGRKVFTTDLPSTGFLAAFVVRVVEGLEGFDATAVRSYHWLVEAYKWAFAKRTELGDPGYVRDAQAIADGITSDEHVAEIRDKIRQSRRASQEYRDYGAKYALVEDMGTAHINVLAPNGDALSVTSTINDYFGCMLASPSTGIIFNDQMDDFANPGIVNTDRLTAAPANLIVPGKQPLSSLSPTIVVDNEGEVRLLIGGAGGTKITTTVAYGMVRHLLFNETIEQIVRAPRIHHQLMPPELNHELTFNHTILDRLRDDYGHFVSQAAPRGGFGSVVAIGRDEHGIVTASFDKRRGGSAEVF